MNSTAKIAGANKKPDRRLLVKWIAINGSIFTEKEFRKKVEWTGATLMVRDSIAFNVFPEVAENIVELHNRRLVASAWSDCS